jgi:hypothetical protein
MLADLAFTQFRHAPSAPAYDGKHPNFSIWAENDEQEGYRFLRCCAPGWVGVGHPKERDVEDDENAAEEKQGNGEECKAGKDGAFGCLEKC